MLTNPAGGYKIYETPYHGSGNTYWNGELNMKRAAALILAVCMLALAACGTPAEEDPAVTGEVAANTEITVGETSVIPDYDPANWYISTQSTLFSNVYSTLIDVISTDDLQLELRANLAESWETEEDGMVWVFHLNPDAVYSNGDKVTAEHVKTCFERNMDNPYTMSYVAMIDSIEVRDENTVAFRLAYPWASVPNCWYMIAVYNVELYDADPEGYMMNPVGSGPYTLESLDEAAGSYTLKLKDEWWGAEKPAIETINVKAIPDPSTAIISLQSGDIDTYAVYGTNMALVEGDPNITTKECISVVPRQLLVNANVEPLNNPLVREAISYAIDYEAVRAATCSGYVSSKDSTIVFGTPEMDIPEGVQGYTYDPDRARELIAESGLATPIDVGELIGGTDNGSAEMVAQYLSEVGIKATVTNYEINAMVQKFMEGSFTLGITTGSGGMSAAENLNNYYGSGQPYNFNKFSNERVDEIISEMMATSDEAETVELLSEALEIIVGECTNFNLGVSAQYIAYNSKYDIPPSYNGIDFIRVR